MALGDPYATLLELKAYLQIGDAVDDDLLNDALASTSRGIEGICQRQFNAAAEPSPRTFRPFNGRLAYVADFHTTTGLLIDVDSDGDGVFETSIPLTDVELEPLDGIVDDVPEWPFSTIRLTSGAAFPAGRAALRVTAHWGWDLVPAEVKQACLIVAAETFKLKDAPFGVAGFGDYGVVRVRNNPIAMSKLARYVRDAVLVA